MSRTQWNSRTVTDVVGTAGSIGAMSLALAGTWWKCGDEGEGWITDEADMRDAAEYLRAVAHEN